jgi:hypothetical protein
LGQKKVKKVIFKEAEKKLEFEKKTLEDNVTYLFDKYL